VNIIMENSRKKSLHVARTDAFGDSERRRISRIIHDDRGNARVDWHDAPSGYQRQVFEIEAEPGVLSLQQQPRTFNPYECDTPPEPKKGPAPKKDLRKLSEWIKLMRDLEEKKRSGG
jgi:hypothetical protein